MSLSVPNITDIKVVPEQVKIDIEEKTGTFIIKSQTTKGLAFKIKTTRPREYIVEPAFGKLRPFSEVAIAVKLTAESTIDENSVPKDKSNTVQSGGETCFLISRDHRFKIEIYQFDWRETEEELKQFLKKKDITGVEKKLEVCINSKKNSTIHARNEAVDIFVWVFIGFVFFRLVSIMLG